MKHIHFFATREDLVPVLAAFERTASVKYVHTGRQYISPELKIYASGLEAEGHETQLSLFAQPQSQLDKRRQLGQLLDRLTARYGEGVIRLGETRGDHPPRQRDPASFRKEEVLDRLTTGKKSR